MIDLSFTDTVRKAIAAQVAQYEKPYKAYKNFAVLIPWDFYWTPTTVEFWGTTPAIPEPLTTYICHGHSKERYCRNDYYCHVFGYRPTGKEDPRFIEAFYKKWPTYIDPGGNSISPKPVQLDFGNGFGQQ